MSAVPRQPDDMGYTGLRMTADEYLALGETDEHYELIDGVVVMSPCPSDGHNEVAGEIFVQLKNFARAKRTIRAFYEIEIRFGSSLVYQPDVMAYCQERLTGSANRVELAPDLAVEVLSPSTRSRDLVTKRHDYARFGVGEYWIVDPETGNIRALQRKAPDGPFVESLVTGDSLVSTALPGFTLDLRLIREVIETSRRTQPDEQ